VRGRIARHALVGSAAGAGLGLLVVGGWPLAVVAGLTGLLAGLFAYREHRKLTPRRPALPARWLMALPPAAATRERLEGTIVAPERCRAPLSGRECVAYEVGIAKGEQPPGELHAWVLLEQRIVTATVDGRSVDATRTHLDLRRERIGTVATVSRDEVARAFLRQRGFGPESDALHVFESILEPEARVSLEHAPDGDRLRPLALPEISPR
jgi:hypothetical protein